MQFLIFVALIWMLIMPIINLITLMVYKIYLPDFLPKIATWRADIFATTVQMLVYQASN